MYKRQILGKYAGLTGALTLLVYTNLVACLLSSRMAYDAYGSADTVSFGVFCLGGLLAAYVLSGFLNYFLQVRFVITTVISLVVLTTAMFAILMATEAETTGASATPREVDWRLIPATVLLLFAVLILTPCPTQVHSICLILEGNILINQILTWLMKSICTAQTQMIFILAFP